MSIPDYEQDLQILQDATDNISEPAKKTDAEQKLTKLRQKIIAWGTEDQVRKNIDALKSELKLSEETPPSSWFQRFKATVETQSKETLTVQYINTLFEKLPTIEQDPVGRSFVLQFLWGKLRASGYLMTIENNRVSLRTRKQNDMNLAPFTETINNHIKAGQISLSECTQTVIIWSGTMGEYIEMNKINPDNINNADYILYLKKKYKLPENFIADDIKEKNIPDTDKALLFSSLNNGLAWVDMSQVVNNYTNMQKDAKEVFDSQAFKQAQKVIDTVTGWKNKAPENTQDIARQFSEDPAGALSGKPLTTIGAGIALIMGLGYEKGKGFSLWTGLTRGFMGLIALFLGNGIAKEWGMDPKALIKEGMDAMKDGGKKAWEAAQSAVATVTGQEAGAVKPGETIILTETQKWFRESISKNIELEGKVKKFSEDKKKYDAKEIGDMDAYLTYIEKDIKDIPLVQLFPNDHKKSIFSGDGSMELSLKDTLDPLMFKTVFRAYLMGTGYDALTGTGDVMGLAEKEAFLKNNSITDADIQTKKLSDILPQIQQKRQVAVVTPMTSTAPVAPTNTPVDTKKPLVIGWKTVEMGKYVQIQSSAKYSGITPVDSTWKTLPILNNGSQVKFVGEIKKINNIDHVEVEYSGKRMYVQVMQLKTNP